MATLAVPSAGSTTFQSGVTVVVTKPASLAVGDLMMAFIANDQGKTVTPASGFTAAGDGPQQNVGGGVRMNPFYKVADAGDVAASNFTFTAAAGNSFIAGGILRITGFDTSQNLGDTSISNFGSVTDSNAPVFTATITPSRTDSLLIFVMYGATGTGSANMSNYACVTSNPTWTEQWDFLDTASFDKNFGCATAVRSQVTATGNFSASGGNAVSDWIGYAFFITRNTIFSASLSDTTSTSDSVTANLTLSVLLTDILTVSDSLLASASRIWNKVTKHVSTWINQVEDL